MHPDPSTLPAHEIGNLSTSTVSNYYTGLNSGLKRTFTAAERPVLVLAKLFTHFYRLSTRFYEVIVVLTTCASDERVYGLSAWLPDEPAHMGCRMLGGVYRCRGLGAWLAACAAPDGPVRVLGIRRTFTGRAAAGRVLAVY